MFSCLYFSGRFLSSEQSDDAFLKALTARLVFDHPTKSDPQIKKLALSIQKTQQAREDMYARNLIDVLPPPGSKI